MTTLHMVVLHEEYNKTNNDKTNNNNIVVLLRCKQINNKHYKHGSITEVYT